MSSATEARKTERRLALETPYARDQERSIEARAQKGLQPKSLPDLLRWFRGLCADETPRTIHKAEVWHDHALHGEGGSALGSLAWSDPFRRYLENSDSECDAEGMYLRPLAASIFRLRLRYPLTAQHLYRLTLVDGDYRRHAENVGWQYEEMSVYLTRALQMLWREFSPQSLRLA